MSFREDLVEQFADREFRHGYLDSFIDASIATQIKVLREQRGITQAQLAAVAGMKQSTICRLENSNNSSWQIRTLKKLAEAFDLALSVKFESFGSVLSSVEDFGRDSLERLSFEDDPIFQFSPARSSQLEHLKATMVVGEASFDGTSDEYDFAGEVA